MRYVGLFAKLLAYIYLLSLVLFLATGYDPRFANFRAPFVLVELDLFTLLVHEAGHVFFSPLGTTVYFLGGSLFQILTPLLIVAYVVWKQPSLVGIPGFWLGESCVNTSVYIRDAPFQQLRLAVIGGIHDWHWLLADHLDWAEPLGVALLTLGLILAVTAIAAGVLFSLQDFLASRPFPKLPVDEHGRITLR